MQIQSGSTATTSLSLSDPISAPTWLRVVPAVLLLSACGGNGDDPYSSGLAPVLQVGMQRQYVGTSTRSVVYADPNSPGNTLTYTFAENQSVQANASSAPADFDVHTDYTYSIVSDPGVGSVPISQSVDSYQNLDGDGYAQVTITVGQDTTSVANDESSNALGGGPYTATTTTSATFPTARSSFSYPLRTGDTMTVPQSSMQNITFTDVNAGGAAPPNGSNAAYTRTRTENDDGSFAYQATYTNGDSSTLTQSADGSGSYTVISPTASTTTTLSLPESAGGTSTLPVTRSTTPTSTGTTTSTNYAAADWYPNNGASSLPLVLQVQTVVGPSTTLPNDCQGALLRPDIYEIDTTTTNLATINASYSTTKTQSFNADGVTICTLTQTTAYAYDLLTGELNSTTTTTSTTTLNAINY